MSVSSYQNENGETQWSVYVNARSKTSPNIRTQRKIKGLKSEKEAVREELRLIRECERELLEKESKGSTWGSSFEAFEQHFNSPQSEYANLSKITRLDYLATVRKHTFSWWGRPACDITKNELKEFFAGLKGQGISLSHRRKIKFIFNKIFVYGIENRLIRAIDQSPTVGLQLGKDEEKKPDILTLSEIKKLLGDAKKLNHPWFPVWAVALLTGCRSGELYSILWTDVDFESDSITINKSYNCRLNITKCTKAGYWRTVPISSALKSLLIDLKAHANGRATVLPRFNMWTKGLQAKELRKFCIGIGIKPVKFHALRACFATQLIQNGVAPIQIQKICGWTDLKTMQRYVRLAGIEIGGATEVLNVLPELEIIETAGALYGGVPAPSTTQKHAKK